MIIKRVLALFFIWRVWLFVVAFLASHVIVVFGSSFPYSDQVLKITNLPSWIWGFGNFDGVHYLRIAQNGYSAEYSQAFFPLYPLLVSIFANFLPKSSTLDTTIFVDPSFFYSAFILSNLFFILALYLFFKLVRLDFDQKKAWGSVLLLLSFPTTFYFGSIYSESLFLLLSLSSLYLIRRENFFYGGIFILLASATRIFGLLLLPVFIIELFLKLKSHKIKVKSEQFFKAILGIVLAPIGIILYMFYLNINYQNPLYFLTAQPQFGAERTAGEIVLLPQVIFRYFKIFSTVSINSQLFFNAVLEFIFTIIPLIFLIFIFKKMRLSYFIFTLGCLILPTLTGTLSSMPRYALMSFAILPFITEKYQKAVVIIFIILQIILLSLFIRGYWVA